jgi:PAS domain-containing protein
MDAIHATTDFGIGGAWLAEYTLASIGAGTVLFDASGCVTQWDRSAADLLGVREQELAGSALHMLGACWQDHSDVGPQDDPVTAVLRTGDTSSGLVIGVPTGDRGTVRWLTLNLLPVFGVDHAPRAVFASMVDTTAAIEARSTAASWHLAMRSMMRAALAAVVLLDRDGDVLEWNESILSLTDRTEVDLIGARFTDICDVDVEWLWRELDTADAGGVEGVTFVRHRLDREIAVHGRFSAIDHPEYGQIAMAQLLPPPEAGSDSRDGVTGGAALVFEHSVVPMLMVTDAGTIVDANPAAASWLECTRTSLVGDPVICHLKGVTTDDLHAAINEAKLRPVPVTAGRCVDRRPRGGRGASVVVSTTVSDSPGSLLLIQLLDASEPAPSSAPGRLPPQR